MPPRRRGGSGGNPAAVKKGPWSPEEDEVLRQHVVVHGEQDWSSIQSKGLLNRSGKSCRLRWVNKLQPGLKGGKFSPEEERVVLDMQAELGNKWAQIATHLPGRTDNDVKNFWSTRQKRLARLLLEPPPRRRADRQRGSTCFSALSELRAQQEPSSSMITFQATTYDVGQSSSQEPHVDASLPEVIYLSAPVDTAMEMEPGSSIKVPSGTYAETPVPGAGADLASLHYGVSHTGSTSSVPSHEFRAQQEPSSSMITFQDTMYEVGHSSIQEPHEVQHCIDAPLPGVLCLPATVDPIMEIEPGVPFGTHTEDPVLGAGADLASLHHAAFIEPLAVVPAKPLSFGVEWSVGTTVFAPYIEPLEVIPPADPFHWPEDEYFAAAPPRDTSGARFDLLKQELDFFAQL